MNREAEKTPKSRRRWGAVLAVAGALFLLWAVHTQLLALALKHLLPVLAASSAQSLTIGRVHAGLGTSVCLDSVNWRNDEGTDLALAEVEWHWARPSRWGWTPVSWVGRVSFRDVSGHMAAGVLASAGSKPTGALQLPALQQSAFRPEEISVSGGNFSVSGNAWSMQCEGFELLLSERQTGYLRTGKLTARAGSWTRDLGPCQGLTVWRDGTAYLSEFAVGDEITIDSFALDAATFRAWTLRARVFDGYVDADFSAPGDSSEIKLAVNAFNVSLEGLSRFAELRNETGGTIDVAKLTFNGDPAQPLSGQISLRLEAEDFVWRRSAVRELVVGLSVAGRRVRISDFLLRQKANRINLRGTATIPHDAAAWRDAPFDFDVDADVGSLRSLSGLFGTPWNGLSGGLRIHGKGSGQTSDAEGWLKVRGWNLAMHGVRPGSLQADVTLEGRDLVLSALSAQSGEDFLRAAGALTVGDPVSYQGRLELRVKEVARYLEPMGRFSPDWARQGSVLLFWDGDGSGPSHSGVVTLELVRFAGDLNPVPVNGRISGSYSPGNIYLSRILFDRGPLSLSSSVYFGEKGLSVQDVQVFGGTSRLLRGEIFLPLSLDAVLAGKPWEETVMTDREIYAFVRSENLELESLAELFGQETSLRGRVDLQLDAGGPWEDAVASGSLAVENFSGNFSRFRFPVSSVGAALKVEDRLAAFEANIRPQPGGDILVRGALPLIGGEAGGSWTLFDFEKPSLAQLQMTPNDLAGFAPRWGKSVFTGGKISGRLQADGSLSSPRVKGELLLENGEVDRPGGWTTVEDVRSRIVFTGNEAVLEETSARLGRGTLGVAGRFGFADPKKTTRQILLRGEELDLYRDDVLSVVGKADLEARGDSEAGEVKGELLLDGSKVMKSVLLAPRLKAVPATEDLDVPRWNSAPFQSWKLDVSLGAAQPLSVGCAKSAGSLAPDLYLRGTLGDPVLLGTLRAEKIEVFFPQRGRMALSGKIHFTRELPWNPVLDVTGSGQAGPYDISAGIFGPLDERKLLLSSAPPLTAEQMVLLLTTGVAPVPATSGEIAPPTAEQKMSTEPSWLDLDKVRGLLGWGTQAPDNKAKTEWSLGRDAVGYEWSWR